MRGRRRVPTTLRGQSVIRSRARMDKQQMQWLAMQLLVVLLYLIPIVPAPVAQAAEWFPFSSERDLENFVESVSAYFDNLGLHIVVDLEEGTAYIDESRSANSEEIDALGGAVLGLVNLAQTCSRITQQQCSAAVRSHFDRVIQSVQDNRFLDQHKSKFEVMKEFLTVRIYPQDYLVHAEDSAVVRRDIEGVLTVLVYDLPTTVVTVSRGSAEAWAVDLDSLFELAIANVTEKYPPDVDLFLLDNHHPLYLMTSDEVYAATFSYRIHLLPDLIGTYGSLVSIPHRHAVVILPLNGPESIKYSCLLIDLTDGMYLEGPGSISDQIWLYHDGRYKRADAIVAGRKLIGLPSDLFEED